VFVTLLSDDMFNRFGTIQACDRRTDGQNSYCEAISC